ncbi:MAG: hypothetical protein JWO31_359, partial [Phycisphaerales bacterium]|nr:hypothetical protein [Phycisphaerales bacterium]
MPPPLPPKSNIAVPFAVRVDPTWTADCVRRTLTDEPGKGMGSPVSDADADLFLKVCGLVPAGT